MWNGLNHRHSISIPSIEEWSACRKDALCFVPFHSLSYILYACANKREQRDTNKNYVYRLNSLSIHVFTNLAPGFIYCWCIASSRLEGDPTCSSPDYSHLSTSVLSWFRLIRLKANFNMIVRLMAENET